MPLPHHPHGHGPEGMMLLGLWLLMLLTGLLTTLWALAEALGQ
jgi:hypothetical protein